MNSGPLGPVPHVSQDVDAVTVEFRQSRGGPVVTALMADASLGDIGTAYPWRTFRWYMGPEALFGLVLVYDGSVFGDI